MGVAISEVAFRPDLILEILPNNRAPQTASAEEVLLITLLWRYFHDSDSTKVNSWRSPSG